MIEMIVVTAVVRASEGVAEIERKKKTVPEGDDGSKRERDDVRERGTMGEYRQLAEVRKNKPMIDQYLRTVIYSKLTHVSVNAADKMHNSRTVNYFDT